MKKNRGWHFTRKFYVTIFILLALLTAVIAFGAGMAVHNHSKDKQEIMTENVNKEVQTKPGQSSKKPEKESRSSEPESKKPGRPDEIVTVADKPTEKDRPTDKPDDPPPTPPTEDEKVIYLTFDDGPSKNTRRILDILDEYHIHATFFVIHSYDGCEELIREIDKRGNTVGLHSYSHDYSIYSSTQTYFDDLQKISDVVYNATGKRSKLVRFPGGTSNTISREYCDGIMSTLAEEVPAKGYHYFDWNWDSTDAESNQRPVEKIFDHSIAAAKNDSHHVILLMHDAPAKTTTADALPRIIQYYLDAGYRFDVLSENSYTYHHHTNN